MAHTHVFRLARPNGMVELCDCGKWRHSAHNTNPVVSNIPVSPLQPHASIMSQTFINTPDDCQWLRDTHLSERWAAQPIPAFSSAVIHGNEDCPDLIELYADTDPLYTDTPMIVYVYSPETGRYDRKDV